MQILRVHHCLSGSRQLPSPPRHPRRRPQFRQVVSNPIHILPSSAFSASSNPHQAAPYRRAILFCLLRVTSAFSASPRQKTAGASSASSASSALEPEPSRPLPPRHSLRPSPRYLRVLCVSAMKRFRVPPRLCVSASKNGRCFLCFLSPSNPHRAAPYRRAILFCLLRVTSAFSASPR
jgi:hypothetical protein